MSIDSDQEGPARPEWTRETIERFWRYWVHQEGKSWTQPFSGVYRQALVNFADWYGISGGDVLDYGFGPGILLESLLNVSRSASGLEFHEEAVAVANDRFRNCSNWRGAALVNGFPSSLESHSFDLVYCVEVIEHLDDQLLEQTIREIHRLVRPGRFAIFTTPCDENLEQSFTYCPFCQSEFHYVQHLQSFSPDRLSALLTGCGFDVRFCSGIDFTNMQNNMSIPHFTEWSISSLKRPLGFKALALQDRLFPVKTGPQRRFTRSTRRPGSHLATIVQKPIQ